MQRGAGDHNAAHGDRRQLGHGRQGTGAADLDRDPLDHGLGLLCRELVRNGPAWRPTDEAQPLLQIEPVDLVDHAVDVVGQGVALLADPPLVGQELLDGGAALGGRVDAKAGGAQGVEKPGIGAGHRRVGLAPGIGEEAQAPFGGDAAVELAQGAGAGIARIHEGRLALRHATLVQRHEVPALHIDLAAYLQHRRVLPVEPLRHVADGADVGGDVLADGTVAAGGAAHQEPVLVAQRAGQAVDLGLGHEVQRHVRAQPEKAADARDELAHLVLGHGVVEREHRHRVRHLAERLGRGRADPQARAVRKYQLGETLLDCGVAPAQRVVGGIREFGRVALVVEPVVARDLGREPSQLVARLGLGEPLNRIVQGFGPAHQPPIRLAAAARAASVISAPASIRATSSRRSSGDSSRTSIWVRPPANRLPTR